VVHTGGQHIPTHLLQQLLRQVIGQLCSIPHSSS
jgi:hypothetical protein